MDKKKVLIIDDQADLSNTLKELLLERDLEVIIETDGIKGLNAVFSERPDLVLLDINLPGANGIEVCKRLKASSISSNIPVILLTSSDNVDTKIEGLKSGANDYITKPFAIEELYARVESHLRQVNPHAYDNTLTGLPGYIKTIEYFEKIIEEQIHFVLYIFNIKNFILFSANSPPNLASELLLNFSDILKKHSFNKNTFISHIFDSVFLYISKGEELETINKDSFIAGIKSSLNYFLDSVNAHDCVYPPNLEIKSIDSIEEDIFDVFQIDFILDEIREQNKS